MTIAKTNTKTKRKYRRITPDVIAKHKATMLMTGNGTQAVRETDPDIIAPDQRSIQILAKTSKETALEYIDTSLQQIGIVAVARVNEMVQSEDENVATRNSHYVIDHLRGKAVQKSVSLTAKVNIQSVLD